VNEEKVMPLSSRVSIALLTGAALILIGCGGSSNSNPNPNNLTQVQAQQLGTTVYTGISNALVNAMSATQPGSGAVSYTYQCPAGGSIAVSGSLNANSSGVSGTITETPTSCSDGTLVINGAPNMTMGVQESNNGTVTTVNLTISGGVSFSPVQAGQFPTGSCTSNLTVNASVNDSTRSVTCSISGSICGQTVNATCPSGTTL
jgi:hypothetical protein